MSEYTLHCGDCLQVMRAFEPGIIDLTVTSPPYDNLRTYNGHTFDFEGIAQELYRVTKPGGVVVWVVGDATINGSETGTSFRQALYFMGLGFNLETMIYENTGTGAKGSNYYYWQSFEFMFIFSRGQPKTSNRIKDSRNTKAGQVQRAGVKMEYLGSRTFGKRIVTVGEYGYRTNIWRFHAGVNGDDQTDHPAPFPEALARDHILSWSSPGDLVFDPMMGSGTTGKMAIKYQRNFIGIDISAEYVAIAEKRIKQAAAQMILPGV